MRIANYSEFKLSVQGRRCDRVLVLLTKVVNL